MNPTLYDKDYYLWLEGMSQLLQDGKLAELDVENLLEEIQAMARSEKRALASNLRVLLMHLLKWQYQTERRSNSWKSSIVEHRKRIRDSFKDSPSLKPYFTEIFNDCYQDAIDLAAAETGLPLDTFPINCPLSKAESLNPDYLPD
jgi:hypothetical protein